MRRTRKSCLTLMATVFGLACVVSGRAQDVSLLPASLAFSNQALGTTSGAQVITLTNTDDANALAISSIVASGDFTQTNTCDSSVAAGESCIISVKFAPAATGAIDGSISISDNASGSPQVFALKGTGIAQETLSTTTFSFGHVTIGQTSEVETIKLTNHTAAAITISSIKASADFVAAPATTGGCGSTLAANSSCSETVVFVPTELGVISGSLIFTDGGQQQYVNLDGVGAGTAGSPLTLTPATLTFTNQAEGTTSAAQGVTIKNTGTTSLALTFAASGSFLKSNPASGACGSSLAAGASCTVDVQFSPTVLGAIDGGISISYSGADSPQVVSLTGTGIGQLTVSPSSIAFAAQQAGTTSAAKTVTVTNNSASAVSVSSIVKSADFAETNTCGTSIAAGKSCKVSVSFAPNRGGSFLGSVIVTDSATNSPQIVDLSGSGFLVPRFAYVPNAGDGTVSIYTVNAKTGQLRSNGYALAGEFPQQVTVAPSGRFAYVANQTSNSISAYTINASTGALTPISGQPYATESGPVSVTTDPSGKFAYTANSGSGNISAYTIDGGTGALTSVPGSPFTSGENPNSVVVSPSGKFVYVVDAENASPDNISAYTVDTTSGVLTPVSGSPFPYPSTDGGVPTAAAVNPAGNFLYVTSNNDSDVAAFSINTATGALTLVAGSPYSVTDDCSSVTIAPSGKFLYTGGGSTSFSAFEINTTTGALTQVTGSPFATGTFVNWLTLNPQGNILYVTNSFLGDPQPTSNEVWTYSINAATGVPTLSSITRTRQGPSSLALGGGTAGVTYTPKFAYVPNDDGNNVSGYTVNATTGVLSSIAGSPFQTGAPSGSDPSPISAAVNPSGNFVYVADFNGNGTTGYVSAYSINASTGALTAITDSPFTAGNQPESITVDPSGSYVYVANLFDNTISGYSINSSSGALTALSSSPYSTGSNSEPFSVAVDPTGQFLCETNVLASTVACFSIDPASGNLTVPAISTVSTGTTPKSVAVDPSGQFVYVANQGGGISAYTLSTSGSLTAISGSPFPDNLQPISVAVDPTAGFVYAANFNGTDISGFSLDSSTGVLAALTSSPFAAGDNPQFITVDPSGNFVYLANSADDTVSAYTLDASSGALTALSASPFTTGSRPFSIAITANIH
jgi:6-phosphogluconolactonase (cycloisomerase 2 family)